MSVASKVPHRMTITEFQDWLPPSELEQYRWELVDGEAICMAPPSPDHAAIHAEIVFRLTVHLRATKSRCRVTVTPGVIPRANAATNYRMPDLAVTCSPSLGGRSLTDPSVLIEILSPSNEAHTRANIWAYTTIPSAREILLIESASVAAELLTRQADGTWPEVPAVIGPDGTLSLPSIGYAAPLRDFYVSSDISG